MVKTDAFSSYPNFVLLSFQPLLVPWYFWIILVARKLASDNEYLSSR